MVVAVLSVATGILKITQQSIGGPLATVVPPSVQATVGFTGALTGFLMIGSALGLRRGLRAAWYSTVVLLPVTAAQGLLQSSPPPAHRVLTVVSFPSTSTTASKSVISVSTVRWSWAPGLRWTWPWTPDSPRWSQSV